ncbi:hypothetical protein C3I27_03420 [Campylobacter jejuni]|uniref:Uncharacterized protein n=1 Tax=Campylobacter jejuni TaxID=197 RepID=A0AAX1Z4I6_CAMJU|nr:hypothetical protein [Campylobacter jejuni]RTI48476.1 hypothetical protein C3I27_03420 [Campylobacter jejuni]
MGILEDFNKVINHKDTVQLAITKKLRIKGISLEVVDTSGDSSSTFYSSFYRLNDVAMNKVGTLRLFYYGKIVSVELNLRRTMFKNFYHKEFSAILDLVVSCLEELSYKPLVPTEQVKNVNRVMSYLEDKNYHNSGQYLIKVSSIREVVNRTRRRDGITCI